MQIISEIQITSEHDGYLVMTRHNHNDTLLEISYDNEFSVIIETVKDFDEILQEIKPIFK